MLESQDSEGQSAPTPEESDFRALAAFRSALRRFIAVSDASALAAGLTPQRYQALLAIRVEGGRHGLCVGALAENLVIRPHSAAELANRLETAGLVARAADPSDRRRVLLKLTKVGDRRLDDLSRVQLAELEQHRESLEALLLLLRTEHLN